MKQFPWNEGQEQAEFWDTRYEQSIQRVGSLKEQLSNPHNMKFEEALRLLCTGVVQLMNEVEHLSTQMNNFKEFFGDPDAARHDRFRNIR